MAEEILPNLYRIEIPLPRSPLKALNSYLIMADGRYLLIDTGMNRPECLQEMTSTLRRLDVDLKKTDFFITHLHADHLGLASTLATATSAVHFNEKEAAITNAYGPRREERWQELSAVFLSNGFPEDEHKKGLEAHPARRFGLNRQLDYHTIRDGDTLEIGDYSFKCIETPGHSPGHTCLYEANKKILISGDHILFDITPNIAFWLEAEMEDPLQRYLESLEKVYALDVNLVLTGHRSIMNNHRDRIRELRKHHEARLNEVIAALGDGGKTAFQIASYITWDINCRSWELFPPQQKWFAFGETLAHLVYLQKRGAVRRRTSGSGVQYSLT